MLHLPILRKGEAYRSLDVARVPHYRTGEAFVEVSQANAGLIRRDLLRADAGRGALADFRCSELVEMCERAAAHFAEDALPLAGELQTPEDYVRQVTATTALPHALVRRNMEKVRGVLAGMKDVLRGLTRDLDLSVLDEGFVERDGHALSFYPRGHSLGVVLPSNSPGVHSLWIPAFALKTPLVLKPGAYEPWTPLRVVEALAKAGAPPEAFSFYPTSHAGASEILSLCGRDMFFGDASSLELWRDDPRVELHGPGFSKVVIGEDCVDEWEAHLDVIVSSVAENGGRSCVNASGVWVSRRAEEIAEGLARELSVIEPRAENDPGAQLAPFNDPRVAERIDLSIETALKERGARDVTEAFRGGGRLVNREGCAYLLPTVVICETPEHPLANREYLFPFVSVVNCEQESMPEAFGRSLAVTLITRDESLVERFLRSPHVDRLNIGPVPTNSVAWDQPHEGNLFEHLYARRALQRAAGMRG